MKVKLHHSWPQYCKDTNGKLPAPAVLSPRKSCWYQLDRRLVGMQSCPESWEHFLSLSGIEPRPFGPYSICMYRVRQWQTWNIPVVITERTKKTKLNSMVWVRERTIPTERPPLVGEVIANFWAKGCHVVSVTGPYGRILGFLDGSRYFSIK
jgi:hypothetical protein